MLYTGKAIFQTNPTTMLDVLKTGSAQRRIKSKDKVDLGPCTGLIGSPKKVSRDSKTDLRVVDLQKSLKKWLLE